MDEEESFHARYKKQAEEAKPYSVQDKKRVIPRVEDSLNSRKQALNKQKEAKLPTKRFDLNIKGEKLDVVLRSMAKLVDQNILIDDRLKGDVSIDFKNVPWDKAFLSLLKSHSLQYVWEDEILRIVTLESMERELQVSQLQQKLTAVRQQERMIQPLQMRTIKIKHLDAKQLAKTMTTVLDANKQAQKNYRGTIIVNEDTNNIIINAIPDDLNKMISLVEQLDHPSIQVLIEAKIVLTNEKSGRELGVQWGGVLRHNNYWMTPGANSTGLIGSDINTPIAPTTGWASNFPAGSLSTPASGSSLPGQLVAGNGLTLGLSYFDQGDYLLSMQLSALEQEGKANILSTPSITTLDNKQAYIESGSEIPYQSSSDNAGTTTEFKKAVLRLEVTPHVIDNEMVKLEIFASNDEPDKSLANKDQEPAIFTRKTQTTVLLMDGQTTVIAGLTREFTSDGESGVPWLKDLPFFGKFFKTSTTETELNDMLIFITPHILKPRSAESKKSSQKVKEKSEAEALDDALREMGYIR